MSKQRERHVKVCAWRTCSQKCSNLPEKHRT